MAHNGHHTPNKLALAAGFGIGITWILVALFCLYSAMKGAANDRPDFALAWGLVGVLLLGAGGAALVGTWWHQFRVLPNADH